jgi:hypothetical protein
MKGYFQRLAASILNPRSAVHPLSGSVFTRHTTDAAISATTPVAAPATVNPLNTPRTTEANAFGARETRQSPAWGREETVTSPGPIEPESTESEPREKRESPPANPFQPLVSPVLVDSVPSAQKGTRNPDAPKKPELSTAFEPHHEAGLEERVREPQRSPTVNRLVPLAAELSRETLRALPGSGPHRRAVAIPNRAVTVPPREPDIEIHIGRIEVLAVPPVVRPAPPPVRKGLNLSEYLLRSDARTR